MFVGTRNLTYFFVCTVRCFQMQKKKRERYSKVGCETVHMSAVWYGEIDCVMSSQIPHIIMRAGDIRLSTSLSQDCLQPYDCHVWAVMSGMIS